MEVLILKLPRDPIGVFINGSGLSPASSDTGPVEIVTPVYFLTRVII